MTYIAHNEQDTKALAQEFASKLVLGDIVLLNGDLGAGKTTFTRYVFESLGVKAVVNSPTFAIMKMYISDKGELYHFDTYRVDVDEAIEAGFDEIFTEHDDKIIFVEWSENISALIPKAKYIVNIKYIDENSREIEVVDNE